MLGWLLGVFYFVEYRTAKSPAGPSIVRQLGSAAFPLSFSFSFHIFWRSLYTTEHRCDESITGLQKSHFCLNAIV